MFGLNTRSCNQWLFFRALLNEIGTNKDAWVKCGTMVIQITHPIRIIVVARRESLHEEGAGDSKKL